MATAFPTNQKTYAVLMTAATTVQKVQEVAAALKNGDADNIAVWSLDPFDITQQSIWPQVEQTLKALGKGALVVEKVTEVEVDAASTKITVVKAF